MSIRFTLLFVLLGFFGAVEAQCPAGEAEVEIVVETDNWGYETYWQLLPNGNSCGNGAIFSGGNAGQVGCNGGGQQDATAGGYGNNGTFTEGPWCLTLGDSYDIVSIDDYGDGGANFTVTVNGFEILEFGAAGSNSTETFIVAEPPALDLSTHHNLVFDYTVKGNVGIRAEVKNEGQDDVTSFDLNYSIEGGNTVTQSVTGMTIPFGEEIELTHTTQWDAQTAGVFSVDVWVSNVNGNTVDENPSNDHIVKPVVISDNIPNILDSYITEPFDIEEVANTFDQVSHPRDLDFHPDLSRKELWVVNKSTENSGGTTVTIWDAGEDTQTSEMKQDGNAWHFMSLPTAMAFGENGNWANSPGVQDSNHGGGTFTGPALWSSDPAIYAIVGSPSTAEFNGSHLDMLHGSPFSMGIAHLIDNTYFVYDSWNNEIVKYAFNGDHGPGKDDHDNGEVYRYSEVFVEREGAEIPNHMVVNKSTGMLYFADHKNSRVTRMDVNSGNVKNTLPIINETLALHVEMENVDYSQYITTGLTTPCGIEVIENRLLVGDYYNGNILLYNIEPAVPELLMTIETGATGLMGIKVGPEGRIWYVDAEGNTVNKINVTPVMVSAIEDDFIINSMVLYPNPAVNEINIKLENDQKVTRGGIAIVDVNGSQIMGYRDIKFDGLNINVSDLPTGIYFVRFDINGSYRYKKFIKN